VEAAWFSPEQGREMWQDYLRRKQLPAQQTQHFPQRRELDEPSPHRVFVYNTGSEVIPPYACMRVVGTRSINNVTAIDVEKPTSTDGEFLFNCQYPIAVAAEESPGVGWAFRFGVVIMLGSDPSEPGAEYGPIVGSWEIEEGAGPFVVYGHHRANELTDDRALIGRFAGGTGKLKEGLMVACLGDGWYEIEEAEFRDEPAGFTYSGITGIDDGCDLCTVADIDTTVGSACETATEVVLNRTRPTGLATFVYAHDARRLPIRIGGHVRMLPIHRAANGEQLYAIVSAEYRMVKDPRPDYECCNGTVTLVGCDWIIHEGVACTGWRSECPS
jgi:hypothetical protein